MATAVESQRLISVSLGKIAQSRGQRGGINLHRNLLVATVLHKARTAYMMESYSYQQNLHRQKLMEQQQQIRQSATLHKPESVAVVDSNKGELCRASPDSNLGQSAGCPVGGGERESEISPSVHETPGNQVQDMAVDMANDKENSPPSVERVTENVTVNSSSCPDSNHLSAATQLSREAKLSLSEEFSMKQHTLTNGNNNTSCNVLKRRRDNPTATSQECPVIKKSRVSQESSLSPQSYSDYSSISDESDFETCSVQPSDIHQISNLVNIFSSGFAGLCDVSNSEPSAPCYHSDLDFASSQSHYRKITTKAG